MKTIKPFKFSQAIHGVQVKPLNESGRDVRIRYNGLLAASGAADVFMHYGFGESDNWASVGDMHLERTYEGWESTVAMHDNKQLNFCFRDSAHNWDNNNGLNWIYRIS
ncbi:MAG: carbohydrate-binding protein [Bacillota bacterium]